MSSEAITFFVMPIVMLKEIRTQMETQTSKNNVDDILYEVGIRCGSVLAQTAYDSDSLESLKKEMPDIWIEAGLGILEIVVQSDDISVRITRSSEAYVMGGNDKACHFSRGFLAGLFSETLGTNYFCEENECINQGKNACLYSLKRVDA